MTEKPKKYIRTQMKLDNGEIVCARICVATGEVKPHKYPVAKPTPKARKLPDGESNGLAEGPPWTRIPVPAWATQDVQSKKLRVTKANPNNIYLKDFMFYSDAIEDHPVLDDLFVGTTSLGEGDKNPLSKGMLFSMLRDLDDINVKTVQAYTGYSMSYCWKLAQHLRVLSVAFDKELS